MKTVDVKIKRIREGAVIPQYQTKGAACFDLVANMIERVGKGKYKIYFGIACEIPEGCKINIVPRSSFTLKGFVQANSPGQVDSDYRGELMWFIQAIPNDVITESELGGYSLIYPELPFKEGDRCAQAFVEEVTQANFIETNELGETERGSGGFGSTGK